MDPKRTRLREESPLVVLATFKKGSTRIYSGAKAILLLVAVVILNAGCENQPTEVEDYVPQVVLQGYLTNGQPVDSIYLQWVAPLQDYYDVRQFAIPGADMSVFPADDTSKVLHLDADSANPWIYRPRSGESLIPQTGITYRIEVKKLADNIDIWSEALMPDSMLSQVLPLPTQADTLDTMNREDPNLIYTWEEAAFAGGYNLNVTCLTNPDSLLPLDPDFIPGQDELKPEDIRLSAFWPMRYDQFEMVVPWFLFNYEGWHRIELQAVTEDYYNYGLSIFRFDAGLPIQLESNIHGGLGIFAAMSRQSWWVYMLRVE